VITGYRFLRALGAGAMGEVFLVENIAAGRVEALKVLKPIASPEARRTAESRFRREIRAAGRLDHQNIVPTYDCGRLDDGRLYLTMEYVAGTALSDMLVQRGPLPIAMTLGILAEAADALHHAHAAGVVHRDIKPHNMILADHPHGSIVRILDLGMAKILDPELVESMRTKDGAVFGTPAYMAPEQCKGLAPDPRTDLYALGCVAFELVAGEPPFRGSLTQVFAAHLKEPPCGPGRLDPGAVPVELDAVIVRCMQKRPDDRFQCGADLCAAIQQVPGYRPLRVHPARATHVAGR
jgi:serine/threonine-protein kinase